MHGPDVHHALEMLAPATYVIYDYGLRERVADSMGGMMAVPALHLFSQAFAFRAFARP